MACALFLCGFEGVASSMNISVLVGFSEPYHPATSLGSGFAAAVGSENIGGAVGTLLGNDGVLFQHWCLVQYSFVDVEFQKASLVRIIVSYLYTHIGKAHDFR